MRSEILFLVCMALSFDAIASDSNTYYWRTSSSEWSSFAEPANWVKGTSADGEEATDIPGADDWLHYTTGYANHQYMDMGGLAIAVKGVDFTDATLQYGWRYMGVRNGSLTFTESFLNRQVRMTVGNGGKFAVAPTCGIEFTWGGAVNVYQALDGGTLELCGAMRVGNLCVTNRSGGTVVVDPRSFCLTDQGSSSTPSCFDNSGTMSFPNGLSVSPDGKYGERQGCRYSFTQRAGTMTVGGSFTADGTLYNDFVFDLQGGTLEIVGDVTMSLFNSVGMLTEGATATIDIADGVTLDWSNAVFADHTTLDVTGSGTLIFGASYPTALNLADGVTLGFGCATADLHAVTGVGVANFVVPSAACTYRNQILVRSGDAELLAAISARLECERDGWFVVCSDGQIRLSWSSDSRKFIWKGMNRFGSFFDCTKWSTSWDEGLPQWESSAWSNDEMLIPGENDYWLYGTGLPYKAFYFDMDGASYRVGGFFGTDGQGAYQNEPGWPHAMVVTNGVLEIARNFTNQQFACTVASFGRMTLARESVSRLGLSSWSNVWTVASGGELRHLGAIAVNNLRVDIAPGGRFVLDPRSFDFDEGARDDLGRGVFSAGTLEIPHGLAMGSANAAETVTSDRAPVWTVRSSGELLLGGNVAFAPSGEHGLGRVRLDVLGGIVTVTDDTAFLGLEAVTFTNDDVAVSIDAGATLSLTNVTFGNGMALAVSGIGTLAIGREFPATLELGQGVTLSFEQGGAMLGDITGIERANLVLGKGIRRRTVLAESDDTALLNSIAQTILLPEGFVAYVDGEMLIVRKKPVGAQIILR